MRYNKIRYMDVSNGPGIRVSLFTQGCPFHCKGCFNEVTWDFNGGEEFTKNEINTILDVSNKNYIAGLSILGGEPLMEANLPVLLELIQQFKARYPDKTVWIWTGNNFETLLDTYADEVKTYLNQLLHLTDVVVDGQFNLDLKDPHLKYCGSSNQRVIDVKKTLAKRKIVLYE